MCSNADIASVLAQDGFYLFTGCGYSMWPLIRQNVDVVEIRPCTGNPVRGDVILFKSNGVYVLHRIVEVRDGVFITRGDNNVATETVASDDVLGIMTGLWRSGRRLPLGSVSYRMYARICIDCPKMFGILKKAVKKIRSVRR